MKNLLNVIVDILTLVALSIAAVGHVLNWYDFDRMYRSLQQRAQWHDKWADGKVERPVDGKLGEKNAQLPPAMQEFVARVTDSQQWHATRSGAALGALTVLIMLSLVIPWGAAMRRLLNLLMFAAAFTALIFEILFVRDLQTPEGLPAGIEQAGPGFLLALVPTCIAIGFSLIRMIWTMPPARAPRPPEEHKPVGEQRAWS